MYYKFVFILILTFNCFFHFYDCATSNQLKEYVDTKNTTVPKWDISRFHVSLHLKEVNEKTVNVQFCSGALMSKHIVLTSKRCLWNKREKTFYNASELYVALSTLDLNQNKSFIFNITNIKYRNNSGDQSDVALLILDVGVSNDFVLSKTNLNSTNDAVCALQIWSKTKMASNFSLQKIDVLSAGCDNSNGKICALYSKSYGEPLLVESGGPLLCGKKLVGILIGASGMRSGYPIFYTNVTNHLGWIRNTTQADVTQNYVEFGEGIDVGGGDIFGGDDDDDNPYYPYNPYGDDAVLLLPSVLLANLMLLLYIVEF